MRGCGVSEAAFFEQVPLRPRFKLAVARRIRTFVPKSLQSQEISMRVVALAASLILFLLPVLTGCANSSYALQRQSQTLQQEQLALQQRNQELQNRANTLDRDNQELETLLAQTRQQSKVVEDQLAAVRDQLSTATAQLAQARTISN